MKASITEHSPDTTIIALEGRMDAGNAGEFNFGFAIEWMHKDLGFCLAEAERLGLDLPMSREVDARYQALIARGLGRCDTSVLIRQFDAL